MMKKLSQKQIILNLLADYPDRKFFGYELVKVNTKDGWLGSQADRRARELAVDGLINRNEGSKYVMYWHGTAKDTLAVLRKVIETCPKTPKEESLFKKILAI